MNILILCTGNSCRSQMAEGYLNHFADRRFSFYSAGIENHGVNNLAIRVMKEDGIDISSHTSNLLDDYKKINFDYLITVCDNADEKCPIFHGNTKRIHKSFPDPAKVIGNKDQIEEEFRNVRDQIKLFCKELIVRIATNA
ncbi:arsenate reductase ArsC [Bacteroidota bacterium]